MQTSPRHIAQPHATAGLSHVGATVPSTTRPELESVSRFAQAMTAASLVSTVALGYHGYKRSGGSLGDAYAWAVTGFFAWPIGLPVALVQGFASPK